jgi:hypothetical protein
MISCCCWVFCPEWYSFGAGFVAQYTNEDERLDRKAVVFSPLSYLRGRIWGAMFTTFGRPALRSARRPEAFRG